MAKKGVSGMGFGVGGLFGTIVNCDSTSNSIYCNIMKIINLIIGIFTILCIFYIGYMFYIAYFHKKSKK